VSLIVSAAVGAFGELLVMTEKASQKAAVPEGERGQSFAAGPDVVDTEFEELNRPAARRASDDPTS
jgi:hypothetical protein